MRFEVWFRVRFLDVGKVEFRFRNEGRDLLLGFGTEVEIGFWSHAVYREKGRVGFQGGVRIRLGGPE